MKTTTTRVPQSCSTLLACFLVLIGSTAAPAQNSSAQQFPDSPGTVHSQASAAQGKQFSEQPSSQPQAQAPQDQTRQPVGTAAAEAPVVTGVAASEPAGVAIAPAKQRRARIFLIKVGAIVGAGVAVGAVAALASASPSRPTGR
jgi:hypothetical protein